MICGATGTRPLKVPPRTLNPTLRVRAALGDQGARRVTGVPMTTLSATVPRTTGPAVTPDGGVAEATTAPTARQSRTPPASNARRAERCGRNRGMTTRPSVVVLAARLTGARQSWATLPDPGARCQGRSNSGGPRPRRPRRTARGPDVDARQLRRVWVGGGDAQ